MRVWSISSPADFDHEHVFLRRCNHSLSLAALSSYEAWESKKPQRHERMTEEYRLMYASSYRDRWINSDSWRSEKRDTGFDIIGSTGYR
jgi:hypothetical protein